MRVIANSIKRQIPGTGFMLFTFDFNSKGRGNYVSNANRQDMIEALEELISNLKKGNIIKTPEEN